MEGSPLNPADNPEKKESSGKKKNVKAIGGYAVEPKLPAAKPESDISQDQLADEFPLRAAETKSEAEAPLESLSEAERQVIVSKLAAAAELGATEPSPDTEADPAAAAEQAVKQFRRHIIEDGKGIETAAAETLAELQAGPETALDTPDMGDEFEDSQPSAGPESPASFDDEVVIINRHNEATPDAADPEKDGQITPPRSSASSGMAPGGFSPNLAPPAPAPTRVEYYDRGNDIGMLILGGIIGYLIGRRRGRIKTQKKLLPIQKKLEKEVKSLQQDLQTAETEIRATAIKQARQAQANQPRQRAEKPPASSRTPEKSRPAAPRDVAPEAHQLHGKPRALEHLGQVLIDAPGPGTGPGPSPDRGRNHPSLSSETIPTAQPSHEQAAKLPLGDFPEATVQLTIDKSVQTMNRAELLRLSEKITVDGSTLRQVYETNLVGERGLRRLVSEHLRGGNVKKVLRREIVEREIDFERDPVMRDYAAKVQGQGSSATLDDLLHQATVTAADDPEEASFLKSRANYEASQQARQRKQRHVLDIMLAGTILALVGLIVALYLSRG